MMCLNTQKYIESEGSVRHGANGDDDTQSRRRGQNLSSQRSVFLIFRNKAPSSDVRWETERIRRAGLIEEENQEEGKAQERRGKIPGIRRTSATRLKYRSQLAVAGQPNSNCWKWVTWRWKWTVTSTTTLRSQV